MHSITEEPLGTCENCHYRPAVSCFVHPDGPDFLHGGILWWCNECIDYFQKLYFIERMLPLVKSWGFQVVRFYTRADLDEDQELADNLSLIPEDGLFIKEEL